MDDSSDGTNSDDLEEYDPDQDSVGSLEEFIVNDEDVESSEYEETDSESDAEFTDSDDSEEEDEEAHSPTDGKPYLTEDEYLDSLAESYAQERQSEMRAAGVWQEDFY